MQHATGSIRCRWARLKRCRFAGLSDERREQQQTPVQHEAARGCVGGELYQGDANTKGETSARREDDGWWKAQEEPDGLAHEPLISGG